MKVFLEQNPDLIRKKKNHDLDRENATQSYLLKQKPIKNFFF